jgi:hypothetical protein
VLVRSRQQLQKESLHNGEGYLGASFCEMVITTRGRRFAPPCWLFTAFAFVPTLPVPLLALLLRARFVSIPKQFLSDEVRKTRIPCHNSTQSCIELRNVGE